MKRLWSLWLQEQLHDLTALLEDNVEIEHFIKWRWTCSCQFWCFRRKSFELIKSPLVKTAFPCFLPQLGSSLWMFHIVAQATYYQEFQDESWSGSLFILVGTTWKEPWKKNNELDELDRGHDLINWRDLCLQILSQNFGWLKSLKL